jgi:hypothetical protein
LFEILAPLMPALLLLTGCATASHTTPAVRLMPGRPPAGYGTLIMYTPQKRFQGGATVFIDDVAVFKLHAQDYTWIYIRGGEHILRTQWGYGLNSLSSHGHVRVAAGSVCDLKLVQWNDEQFSFAQVHAGIRTVSDETAKNEMANLTYCPPLMQQLDMH